MYRCELCKSIVGVNTRATSLVLETRQRNYPARPGANRIRRRGKIVRTDDPGGKGVEIVREVKACPACAAARGAKSERP